MSYRALEYAFGFDTTFLEALREELLFRRIARDEADRELVWTGSFSSRLPPPQPLARWRGRSWSPWRGEPKTFQGGACARGGGTRHVGRHECGQRGRATRWHGGAHAGGGKSCCTPMQRKDTGSMRRVRRPTPC